MPDMNLHVELYCAQCGEDLGRLLGAKVERHPNGIKVTAPPCPSCVLAKDEEEQFKGVERGCNRR